MQLVVVQLLSGLASAASLFLVASGLSLIFGVTRIVNFAHGALFMLGAYIAFTLTDRFSGAFGFWGGMVAAALAVGCLGAVFEILLLRRIYRAPELFQLLATFGATLVVEDVVLLVWGPEDLLAPRAPGLAGAVLILGKRVPSYDLFLIALGPIVLGLLWLAMHRTRWGVLVRAATQDRDMVGCARGQPEVAVHRRLRARRLSGRARAERWRRRATPSITRWTFASLSRSLSSSSSAAWGRSKAPSSRRFSSRSSTPSAS